MDLKKITAQKALEAAQILANLIPAAPEFDVDIANLQHLEERLVEWGGLGELGPKRPMESSMPKKSISLADKLNNLFLEEPDQIVEEFDMLIDASMSLARFDNQSELASHLTEGALLNINTLGAHALSVPAGEYLVWVTDVGHTLLVPTQDKKAYSEVFGEFKISYDVLTPTLLNNWPKIERVLKEEEPPPESNGEESNEADDTEMPKGQRIQSRVNPADIDRPPILRAMEDRGHTVTSLARAVGVQAPAISRILRTPKKKQGDPGGRNPSIGLAAKISSVLRMDPTALFPDIFGAARYEPRKSRKNRGSGMKNAAAGSMRKGGHVWTQGAK